MAPFDIPAGLGTALTFGAVGVGFGAVLEAGGFGDTRKLAAQFYFRDLTVLKVMFTGIAVAAVLVAGASAFGLLDMSRVWVNPTYLWPGIVGGLIMGVGFIVGGFCPGTSVVAASSLKVDGMLFLLGVVGGIWAFGETVGSFGSFFLSSAMGRFTLSDWLGVPTGVAVVLVVAMALALFWAGELAERVVGKKQPWAEVALRPQAGKLAAALALLVASLVVAGRGQPTPAEKYERMGAEVKRTVEERGIFVHPAEVVALRKDLNVKVEIVDLRDERDFNLFHLVGARRIDREAVLRPEVARSVVDQPASTVTFLVSNGETDAVAAWKGLKGLGAGNLYVVEGGINRWLDLYPVPACVARRVDAPGKREALEYRFAYAAGDHLPSSAPDLTAPALFRSPCEEPAEEAHVAHAAGHGIAWPSYAFTKRVKLKAKAAVKGGCG